MNTLTIEGSDVSAVRPVSGIFYVAGIIRSPGAVISIRWEVDGASGRTDCPAWQGQYEVECLTRAGYRIIEIAMARH